MTSSNTSSWWPPQTFQSPKQSTHPACEIIHRLNIDLDVVEVSGGYCLQISARWFLPCPSPEDKRRVVSPHVFVPYNYTTQLVVVDEWSVYTIQSDFANTIFQGGWMVTAVKHEAPRCIMNSNPFYITTNHVPTLAKKTRTSSDA